MSGARQDGLRRGLVAPDGGPVPAADDGPADRGRVSASVADEALAAGGQDGATRPRGREDAAPEAPADGAQDGAAHPEAEPAVTGPLVALQGWFAAVMTHPGRFEDSLAAARPTLANLGADRLEQVLRPSDRQSAAERLAIYHRAYLSRLVGCVQEDFPATGHALGAERFRGACVAYVRAHPSTSPDLNAYSRDFVAFLGEAEAAAGLDRAALAAVATLEWAMIEARHAPAGPAFDLDALRAVPPEGWADLALEPSPGLRFVELAYPANDFFGAWARDEAPALPAPAWSATAVYRWRGRIWRMGFTPPMAEVLQAILRGEPLGAALAGLEDRAGEADVMRWFSEWVSSGFFRGVR